MKLLKNGKIQGGGGANNRFLLTAVAIAAVAIIPATAMASTSITPEIDGVQWNFTLNDDSTVYLTSVALTTATTFEAADIPWTFDYDDETWNVTQVNGWALNKDFFTGAMIVPTNVTYIGQGSLANTRVDGYWLKGSTGIDARYTFGNNPNLKLILFGSSVTCSYYSTSQDMFYWNNSAKICTSGCTTFAPKAGGWSILPDITQQCVTDMTTKTPNATNIVYGAGEDCDIAIDETAGTITATIGNGNGTGTMAFQAVMNNASRFNDLFGLEVRVSVTNAIDYASLNITDDMISDITFDRLSFSITTQDQLASVLAKFPDTPLAIDPTGLTETLMIPEGYDNVYVKVGGVGYEIRKYTKGLVILVK